MTQVISLETVYSGVRFRSRLEARYAVFWDAIGWQWEYEPEVFVLPGGRRYMPDFGLRGRVLAEVKHGNGDFQKAIELSAHRWKRFQETCDHADQFGEEVMQLEGRPPGLLARLHPSHCPDFIGTVYEYWSWATDNLVSVDDVVRAAAKACSERFGAYP